LESLDDVVLAKAEFDQLREQRDAEVGEVDSIAPKRRCRARTRAGQFAGSLGEGGPCVDEVGPGGGRAAARDLVIRASMLFIAVTVAGAATSPTGVSDTHTSTRARPVRLSRMVL
jgi:hypothetical protein